MPSVILDPGHGGSDPGAVYNTRQEKDDVLKLALAVGRILEQNGVDVSYTRTSDVYETPYQKAMEANESGADYLISIHRNSGTVPNSYKGAQTLVYDDSGVRSQLARNINDRLVDVGFKDLGISERPNLVVLRRSKMPAVLVEAGFINSDADNRLFDENFDAIAQAIADGILATVYYGQGDEGINQTVISQADSGEYEYDGGVMQLSENMDENYEEISDMQADDMDMQNPNNKFYRVQVGAYSNKENADRMLTKLINDGFPAFMIYDDGLYKVQVGAYNFLPNAIRMENMLRRYRYSTYITT
jgi:N-acetylmuramoyl-L-alanine amidase